MVMDWQTGLLPDSFTLTGIAIGFVLICAQSIFLGPAEGQVLLTRNSIKLTSVGATTDPGNVFLTGPEALIGGRLLAIPELRSYFFSSDGSIGRYATAKAWGLATSRCSP